MSLNGACQRPSLFVVLFVLGRRIVWVYSSYCPSSFVVLSEFIRRIVLGKTFLDPLCMTKNDYFCSRLIVSLVNRSLNRNFAP